MGVRLPDDLDVLLRCRLVGMEDAGGGHAEEIALTIAMMPARTDSVSAHVQALWQRALERRASDPEGAITSARTLLEAVCKHILDKSGTQYEAKANLPKLYSLAASHLNLSPARHIEPLFKQILGGCHSVVQGPGSLRSRLGETHAQGKVHVKPAPRQSHLESEPDALQACVSPAKYRVRNSIRFRAKALRAVATLLLKRKRLTYAEVRDAVCPQVAQELGTRREQKCEHGAGQAASCFVGLILL